MPNHGEPMKADLHFKVLREAIRAVPSVKYALGVAGLVAAIGIIELLVRQKWIVAIVGTVLSTWARIRTCAIICGAALGGDSGLTTDGAAALFGSGR